MKGKLFGSYFKEMRIKRRLTLRLFCETFGFDPGNISKLERGLLPPPQSKEKLEQYAQALGLRKGSSAWYEFFDLAAASRGQIPEEILAESFIELLNVEAEVEGDSEPEASNFGFIVHDWFGPYLLSPPTRFLRGHC